MTAIHARRARQMVSVIGGIVVTAWVSACAQSPTASPPPQDVVARYEEGTVTLTDLDRRILMASSEARDALNADIDAKASLVRLEVIERLLLESAREQDFEASPAYAKRVDEAYRGTLAERCYASQVAADTTPDEDAMRAHYEATTDAYHRPARRLVYHLFIRHAPGTDHDATQARVDDIRKRVLAGESFLDLARAHSDSASRHQGGALGWLEAGALPPDLEQVVFHLEPHKPSQPISTREGYHLFLVDTALAAKDFSFEDLRPLIHRRLQRDALEEAILSATEDFEWPEGTYVATSDELRDLLETGDPTALLYRSDSYEVTAADFRERVQRAAAEPGAENDPAVLATDTYRTLRLRERLFHHCRAASLADEEAATLARDNEAEGALIELERERRLLAWAEQHPEVTERYFGRNRNRYARTPRLRVRLLLVPRGDDAAATMARLESLHQEGAADDVATVANALSGRVEALGWQTVKTLQQRFPKVAARMATLAAGAVSAPFKAGDALGVLALDERRESESQAFAEVQEQVVTDYLAQHRADVYRAVEEAMLAAVEFELFTERLSADTGSPIGSSSASQGT